MPRLDQDLVMHHLIVAEGAKPVKQKPRKMHPQITLLAKVELKKLLDVGYIRLIDYAEWISNIVPMAKLTWGICICIDFRYLNKACPKDNFPLPNIDIIMDQIVGHAMLFLMDGFSGYNEIKITLEDQHNSAFTCPWGTYYWNVILFGLKNVGATYQREMTTNVHNIDVYTNGRLCG